MATIFTHPAVALGIMPWFSEVRNSRAVLFTGILLTTLPDIDVVGLGLGVPYEHFWGHRGFTHSLFFAVLTGALVAGIISRPIGAKTAQIGLYFSLCVASHGMLDAFTNGGLGIAFFSPFNDDRYFFSISPVEVSTLNIARFFQGQGIPVLKSEIVWIWIPSLVVMVIGYFGKKKVL